MDEIYNRTNSLSLELDEIIDRRNFLLIQYNNPAKHRHQRLPPPSKVNILLMLVTQMLCFDVRFFFRMYTMHELLCYVQCIHL